MFVRSFARSLGRGPVGLLTLSLFTQPVQAQAPPIYDELVAAYPSRCRAPWK